MTKADALSKEIKEIRSQISESQTVLNEKVKQLQGICKHKKVKYESFCSDDWAIPHLYVDEYKCEICGLSASSPEYHYQNEQLTVSENFEKLYKGYWKYTHISQYRLDNFDKHYIVKKT